MHPTDRPQWIEFVPVWDEDLRLVDVTIEPAAIGRRGLRIKLLGWAAAVVAALGVAVGVGAILLGLILVDDLSSAVRGGLDIASGTIETVSDSIDTARDTVDEARSGLRTVEQTLGDLGAAFGRSDTALDDTAEIIRSDLAGSVQALIDSLPRLIGVGDTLDVTLRSLALFGVPYDPEQSIGDGFREMLAALVGVPERLEAQGDLLGDLRADLVVSAANAGRLRANIGAVADRLDLVLDLLDRYGATATEAAQLVADMDATVQARARAARWASIVVGIYIVLFQVIPAALAWWLLRARPPAAQALRPRQDSNLGHPV